MFLQRTATTLLTLCLSPGVHFSSSSVNPTIPLQIKASHSDKMCINRNPADGAKVVASVRMELAIRIQVEDLPEGLFLATSDELPGLVAQGRTVAEALEIARDVARKLIEARREREGAPNLPTTSERRDYTIVVAA